MHTIRVDFVEHREENSGKIRIAKNTAFEIGFPLDILLLHKLYRDLAIFPHCRQDHWSPIHVNIAIVLCEHNVQIENSHSLSKESKLNSITIGGLLEK